MLLYEKKIKISIIDDDEDDFLIISDYLKDIPGVNIEANWCTNYNDALKDILNRSYDLYFVDYRLGAKSGVDLLQHASENNCEEPIILLTGFGNYDIDIKAMEMGAVDYLVKSELTIEKLERSIRYALEWTATLKALRANERKYRRIFEKSKDIIFITDDEFNVVDINDAVNTVLEYSKIEIIGRNIFELFENPEYKEYLVNILNLEDEINDWEIQLIAKNGEKKVCDLNMTRETSPEGRVYFQGIIHDITMTRKIEKANLRAEKLAIAGRLMHTLAHEVRNPLNNITLSVEQMREDITDESSLSFIDIIKRNSKRISDLISELLNTSNPVEIDLKPEFLQTVLDDVISAAVDRLNLNNVEYYYSYDDEPVPILADKGKLVIALLNIVINAVEAMEGDKRQLLIKLFTRDSQAILAIKDTGCGINEENLSRLFEPYFTRKRNGVGLGLVFTLNILKAHNADVEVASVENEGTLFTITFPMWTA